MREPTPKMPDPQRVPSSRDSGCETGQARRGATKGRRAAPPAQGAAPGSAGFLVTTLHIPTSGDEDVCRKGKVRLAQPTSSGRRAPGTAGGWGHAARGGWSRQLWSGPPSSLSVSAERLRLCSHWSKPRYKCILLSPQPRFPDRPVLSLAKWTAAKQDQRFRFQLVTSSRPPHTTHSFILSRILNQNPCLSVLLGSGSAALATGTQVQPHVM